MQIYAENFRGIATAAIETQRLTLFLGKNGAGKSSLAEAVGALLTRRPMTVPGITKARAAQLIHGTNDYGRISAIDGDNGVEILYPDATISTTGNLCEISPTAAGTESIFDISIGQRPAYLATALNAHPTLQDLSGALGASAKHAAAIWATVQESGWDAALAHAKETGARLKGRWEAVAGERYGSKKAATWRPAAWSPALLQTARADLEKALAVEQEYVDAAIGQAAVEAVAAADLQKAAAAVPDVEAAIERAERQLAALRKNETDILAGLTRLPPAAQPAAQQCPHCHRPIAIDAGKIVMAALLPEAEIAARQEQIHAAQHALDRVREEIAGTQKTIAVHQAELANGREAMTTLSRPQQPAAPLPIRPLAESNAARDRAKASLYAFDDWHKASSIQQSIVENEEICQILAPTGIRQTVLSAAIAKFNAALSTISKSAGWKSIAIDSDLNISYNDTPYILASKSEQYRCRCAMQIGIAQAEQAPVIICDGADILDKAGRNGLIRAVLATDLQAIVCATHDGDMPRIPQQDVAIYHVDNGTAILCD